MKRRRRSVPEQGVYRNASAPRLRVLLFPADDPRPRLRKVRFRRCIADFRPDPISIDRVTQSLLGPPVLERLEVEVRREDSAEILDWFGRQAKLWFVLTFEGVDDLPAQVYLVEIEQISGEVSGDDRRGRALPIFPETVAVSAVLRPCLAP